MKHFTTTLLALPLLLIACSESYQNQPSEHGSTLFEQVGSQQSGITFSNDLIEDSMINYFTYPYLYMGGGVAIGDVNNDGLQDIYFTGNRVENKLYLNQGNMSFKDITQSAGVAADDRWITGVCMADVNSDGWIDIYVSVSGKFTTTKNLLYINNGLTNGLPTFTESAEAYGLADEGHSTNGTFFDYDHDGDLDLYVANYPYTDFKTPSGTYAFKMGKRDSIDSDRLFRNNGDNTFTDVALEAGIRNFGLALSATVGDFNNDGWEDIYVSNDFATPDFMYMNNGDGTFTDRIHQSVTHIAYFGMGTDVADFNNDGMADILQMDMTPEDNRRNKANMASMNPPKFWEIVGLGMHYQYMQNALQLNNGVTSDNIAHFSDMARMAGMASTDWSWAGLFADLDNDGWKDVFITNGTRRDINNKDYFHHINEPEQEKNSDYLQLTLEMPSEKVDNYVFRNNGDLTFDKVIKDWGLSFKGYSNGAAYADLDNDGDLDLVVNNIDDPASVFRNTSSDKQLANWLRLRFEGPGSNRHAIGAKVHLMAGGQHQYLEQHVTRGFQSSIDPVMHFGLGQSLVIDTLLVDWGGGIQSMLLKVPVNKELVVRYSDGVESPQHTQQHMGLFTDVTNTTGIGFIHNENSFDDFTYQVLLPHTYSKNGPTLAVGDVNGDGLEDFYVGGAFGRSGAMYVQLKSGGFSLLTCPALTADALFEDMGAVFLDADGDGDQDLYVTSGGGELPTGSPRLKDRFYVNDGHGAFTKREAAIPAITTDGGRVVAGDFDADGDLDLFVAGRIRAQEYPLPAASYILRNESTFDQVKFVDVTAQLAPELSTAGLVTDAVWVDFNGDQKLDLVYVAEWQSPQFWANHGDRFSNETNALGMASKVGWWYSLAAGDFDHDGDVDFIAGNLGLNYKYQADSVHTFDVYVNDYDKNGKIDIVLGYYNEGIQYPVRGRQCSSEQIPGIKKKYPDYNTFASATLEEIYHGPDLESSLHYKASTFASGFIRNDGENGMSFHTLPNEVQLSAINGIVVNDFDHDGHLDAVVAGNLYGAEVETTRGDGGYGKFLKGDGQGGFKAIPYTQSGLFIPGDVKDLELINTQQGPALVVARNSAALSVIVANQK